MNPDNNNDASNDVCQAKFKHDDKKPNDNDFANMVLMIYQMRLQQRKSLRNQACFCSYGWSNSMTSNVGSDCPSQKLLHTKQSLIPKL